MIDFDWDIEALSVQPKYNEYEFVVIAIRWTCTLITDQPIKMVKRGFCSLPKPNKEFIPYDNLTKEQVLDWVFNTTVDKASVEAEISALVERSKNPTWYVRPLPWANR